MTSRSAHASTLCLNAQLARSPTERAAVVQALENSVVDLATNPNGNHVIQRVLQHFSAEGDSMFVYAALERSCYEVATHRHGCCVVQRALDAASLEQRLSLVAQVAGRALEMMQVGSAVLYCVTGVPCGGTLWVAYDA
eukprot:TRINITY_DN17496_c0_g1_i1.p1 TRINITY_DN17496_c0_g1~~TRINITY_DN17496_c0_g1_i1.p1  ORF type:complete len:138 (+),score=37.51 TRINITY_DN17496_c0_g1_i1:818-1231(+)